MTDPTVSVCMIAYNHAPYVSRAVESVLAQQTQFDVKLIVGDDCSTDGTTDILRRYAETFPDRIELRVAKENGVYANFAETLGRCTGKYVAYCDADDYWLDTDKLETQVRHLEQHPECVLCFHNARIEFEDGRSQLFHESLEGTVFRGPDIFARWLIPSASALFRNPRSRLPGFFEHATHGDMALFLWLAQRGELHFIDRVMSVYRRHSGGLTNTFRGITFNHREIRFLEEMDAYFHFEYRSLVVQRIAALHRSCALHHARARCLRDTIAELRHSWRLVPTPTARAVSETAKALLAAVSPVAYRALGRLAPKA